MKSDIAKAYAAILIGVAVMACALLMMPDLPIIEASMAQITIFMLIPGLSGALIMYGMSMGYRAQSIGPNLLGTAMSMMIIITHDGSLERILWVGGLFLVLSIMGAVTRLHRAGTGNGN